jgi:hypothetical protein
MTIEIIGKYEIDFEAEALPADAGWAAYVAVFGASDNPAHRKCIVERKRVAIESRFDSEEAALSAAREHAIAMLE